MREGKELRLRRKSAGLRLADLARFYLSSAGHPVRIARVSQIETGPAVSRKVEFKYRRALVAAVEWKRRMDKIDTKVAGASREFRERVRQDVRDTG